MTVEEGLANPIPAGHDGHVTTDDLRHKALAVREIAVEEGRALVVQDTTRLVIVAAAVVAFAVGAAYFFGRRAAERAYRGR